MPPDFSNPISPEHLLTNQPRITAKAAKIKYENLPINYTIELTAVDITT